ncbi:alkaline phosphatase family protein [Planctomycetota bacterium]
MTPTGSQTRKRFSRRDWLRASAAALASIGQFQAVAGAASRESTTRKRVLVLGIDGMSPHLLRKYVAAGRMPHFANLMRDGDFRPLRTTNPPQSPVAWSSFATGMNPGGHGIFDFIHRDPATLTPYLSTSRTVPPSMVLPLGDWRFPLRGGGVELLRQGTPFWDLLVEHGVPSTLYRMPTEYPPGDRGARILAGLGTPDLLGAYGVTSYFTDLEPPNRDEITDVNLAVVDMSAHRCETHLIGPANSLRKGNPPIRVPLAIFRDPTNPVAKIAVQGQELLLNQGEWSDWVRVQFPLLSFAAKVTGICRFFLKEVHPHFKLYASPINVDPADPALPISSPPDFAQSLAEELGLYYTQGIAQDTKSLSFGLLDDREYWQQAMLVLEERIRAYDYLLENFHHGLLFFYFSSLDLNSHMFWRTMDPRHPLYTPELGEQFGGRIEDLYARMDQLLGKALEHVDERTTLIVLSDHGFQPFYRTFGLNGWLLENGYARLKDPARRGTAKLFANTDWSQTYAYGVGINALYLNLRGREQQGVLSRGGQANMLLERIASELADLKDPETGQSVFAEVYKTSEVYRGRQTAAAPDLILGFNRGYRTSWKTILGTYDQELIADNDDKWSGDHCMDRRGLSGVLLANKSITSDDPGLVDLAPSILAEFGVETPSEMEGKPILEPDSS